MPYDANRELAHYRLKLRQIQSWLLEIGEGVLPPPSLHDIRHDVNELLGRPPAALPGPPSPPPEIPLHEITMVKVFSETKHRERNRIGDKITEWLAAKPDLRIVRTEVSQSSDSEFHCLTITLFLTSPFHGLK